MDKELINQYLTNAEMNIAAARSELNKPDAPPDIIDCAVFTKALEAGGDIRLGHGTICNSKTAFNVKGNTNIFGAFSSLSGDQYAIKVAPGESNGSLRELMLTTLGADSVVNLGNADESQNALAQVPVNWLVDTIAITNHKGKRGIAVNSYATTIRNSMITGINHPNNQDSQAIAIMNSPGGLIVEKCTLSAVAECFLAGGVNMVIPGLMQDIKFIECELFKDPGWRPMNYSIKNLLELKNGWHVLIQKCKLHTCWADDQQGEAYMFTPSNGGQVSVEVVDNEVYDVSSICNITGVDRYQINTVRTQVSFNGGTYKTNSVAMGGRGNFALMDRGPEYLKVNNCDISIDGTTFIELVGTAPVDLLEVTNSRFNYGKYGIRLGGLNDGDNSKGLVKTIKIEGNTILGANSRFKARYPNNVYA